MRQSDSRSPRSALLRVMCKAVEKAGRRLARDFGEVENLQVSRKGPADFVSTADRMSEKILLEELGHARPDYGILSEEFGEQTGKDKRRWIIDPLDGTTNFLHGLPHFAISVAVEEDQDILAGVVYHPVLGQLFTAEKGQGAFLNDRRMRVSGRKRMEEALIATGAPFLGHGNAALFEKELHRIIPKVSGIRRFGAAALDLAYVACGRFDGYWERDLRAWDIAAGLLLVREAGGMVAGIDDRQNPLNSDQVAAANPEIHRQLLSILRQN